jgi:hypothetical protein
LIDAIPVAACAPGITTDQRGVARPEDGNGDGVLGCDIGAVEVVFVPAPEEPVNIAPTLTG